MRRHTNSHTGGGDAEVVHLKKLPQFSALYAAQNALVARRALPQNRGNDRIRAIVKEADETQLEIATAVKNLAALVSAKASKLQTLNNEATELGGNTKIAALAEAAKVLSDSMAFYKDDAFNVFNFLRTL